MRSSRAAWLARSVAKQVVLGLAAHDRRGRRRRAPRRPAAAARGCSCWPSSGSRHRWRAPRAGRPARRRRAGIVLDHDVAALAVLADHPARTGGASDVARGERAGVVGVVERGADVVAHAAVDADVGADRSAVELDRLDGADLVERERRRADDRAARLDDSRGRRGRGPRHSCSTIARISIGQRRRGRRVVLGRCRRCRSRRRGRARAASTPCSLRRSARAGRPRGGRRPRSPRCRRSATDVGVQADQLEARGGEHAADGLDGVARGEREAELLVLVRGRDELVGVRLDADGDPDQHRWPRRRGSAATSASRSISSNESTTMRPTPASTARVSSATDLLLPWKPIRAGSKPGAQGDAQLAAGADVEAQALLGDPARDRRAEERLARVVDVDAGEGVAEGPGRGRGSRPRRATYSRGAELGGEVGDRHPADDQLAVDLVRGRRPERRDERVEVGGRGAARPARAGRRRRAPSRLRGCARLTSAPAR